MAMHSGKVTMKMIASEAGVSVGTVARAINNNDGINEETRRLILDIAERLNYRPNKLAGALARKKAIHIGAVFTEISQDFFSQLSTGISNAAYELEDFGVTIEIIKIDSKNIDEEDASLCSLDVSRFDGLVICSGARVIESLIDRYVSSGIPVFTVNTDASNSSRLLYVGSNSRQSGMMGAEILSMFMGYSGKVAILGDFTRATSFTERFGGFCEFTQLHHPSIQVYPCACPTIDSAVIAKRFMEFLEQFPDINGVFCTRNTCTLGALEAVGKLGREDIHIVGYDVTEKTAEAMRSGRIHALIFQDPYQQGYKAIQLMASHLLEGYTPKKQLLFIENRIVLKSNLNIYCDPSAHLDI